MFGLDNVESTLFIPMLGRIYTSEHFPHILFDEKAISLKEKLPEEILKNDRQGQYALIASASRSSNMDRILKNFIYRQPNGVVVQLGCGLETAYYRNKSINNRWYAVDLPDVIALRKNLLPEPEREIYIAEDAFSDIWIKKVLSDTPNAPLLITAGGLFHYFPEEKIIKFFKMLKSFGSFEIVFDAVNRSGMLMLRKKYMKRAGHGDAEMFFYVNDARDFFSKADGEIEILSEEPYFLRIPRCGLKPFTRISMAVSDHLSMLKMIHIKL